MMKIFGLITLVSAQLSECPDGDDGMVATGTAIAAKCEGIASWNDLLTKALGPAQTFLGVYKANNGDATNADVQTAAGVFLAATNGVITCANMKCIMTQLDQAPCTAKNYFKQGEADAGELCKAMVKLWAQTPCDGLVCAWTPADDSTDDTAEAGTPADNSAVALTNLALALVAPLM